MQKFIFAVLALSACAKTPAEVEAPVPATPVVEAVAVDSITFLTEQYPPFNYEADGKAQGVAVDLLVAMLAEAGSAKTAADFAVIPWSDGYSRVQAEPGTCLFSTTWTDERAPLFKWVGPIVDTRIVVLAKKGSGVAVASAADLAGLTHGVIHDDAGQQLLVAAGVPADKMTVSEDSASIMKSLDDGTVQTWAYEEASARYQLSAAGYDPTAFETVHVLKESTTQYACNKDMSDELIASLSGALAAVDARGGRQEIIDRYMK